MVRYALRPRSRNATNARPRHRSGSGIVRRVVPALHARYRLGFVGVGVDAREDSGGIDEDELPEALAQNAKSKAAKILYKTRKKVAPRDVLRPVRHEFSFQLTQADKVDGVKFEECKLRARRDPDTLTAKAYVNGVLLSTMENGYSSDKDGHGKAFRPGANAITLEVEALQAPSRVAFGSIATWRRRRSAPGWEKSTGASRSAISTIRSASRSRR
jgi:hypothetical protein